MRETHRKYFSSRLLHSTAKKNLDKKNFHLSIAQRAAVSLPRSFQFCQFRLELRLSISIDNHLYFKLIKIVRSFNVLISNNLRQLLNLLLFKTGQIFR